MPGCLLICSTVVVLVTICGADERYMDRRRDYYSDRLKSGTNIASKLKQMGLFNQWGVSYLLTKSPENECTVTFWNGKVLKTAYMISTTDISMPPIVKWPTRENHYYTLYIGDLDGKLHLGKDHPNYTQFQANCIWLVGNIPGCDIQRGSELFDYWPPEEKPSRELHRHLVLVYDQHHTEPFDFEGGFIDEGEDRQDFRIDKFAEFYNFGHPFAANLYLLLDDEDYID